MTKLFNNILVPVDYSDASELAVERAIDIANHFKCNIHLVFAQTDGLFPKQPGQITRTISGSAATAESRIQQVQSRYASSLDSGLYINTCIKRGNKTRAVVDYTLRNPIDLVVIGKSLGIPATVLQQGFNITSIIKKLDCPVLTVRKNGDSDRWLNIVLPVCSMLPIRKIMFASYLAKKYNSRIHLLAISGSGSYEEGDRNEYLHKAYQLLKDNTNLSIECHTMRGRNIADSTLLFAQQIKADLIVVNPGKESMLSGLLNKVFNGFLFNESKIPVMTVSPL